jgi:hypothetical protein
VLGEQAGWCCLHAGWQGGQVQQRGAVHGVSSWRLHCSSGEVVVMVFSELFGAVFMSHVLMCFGRTL